jgi:hypothetical protein
MIIGFCTSCMNRRWQLEQTLPANLELLRGTPHFLAVVDYNSADDLGACLRAQEPHRRDGRLLTFRTEEPDSFHMSLAKNTAHRLALRRRPDVLFSLDADNFLHRETLTAIDDLFARRRDVYLHNWSGHWGDGTMGRVALRAEDWLRVGGYDETFLPMSWQDADLMTRCRADGLEYVHDSSGCGRPVANTIEQKLASVRRPETLREAPARHTLNHFTEANFIHSLRRPIRLPLAAQRRFRGRVDFGEQEVEV